MDFTSYQGVPPVPKGRLDPKRLPNVRSLGKGLSGFIYETTWLGQGRYARKDFPLRSLKRSRIFEEEAKVLLELDHPILVRCLGYTLGKSSSSLVQEYVDDDLQNVVQRRIEAQRVNSTSHSRVVYDIEEIKSLVASKDVRTTGLSDGTPWNSRLQFEMREVEYIISQIAAGMKYLHDKKIAHGDSKPKNVLLSLDESGKTKAVKIADYGLQGTKKLIRLVSKRTRHFEILTWKAPERFEELLGPVTEDSDHPFTNSDIDSDEDIGSYGDFLKSSLAMADVYSFGLTCSYILGAKLLFPELSLTQLRAQRMDDFERISDSLPPTCPTYLQFMIASCLQSDPESRPTFFDICNILKEVGGAFWFAKNLDIGKRKAGSPRNASASDLHRGKVKASFASDPSKMLSRGSNDLGAKSRLILSDAIWIQLPTKNLFFPPRIREHEFEYNAAQSSALVQALTGHRKEDDHALIDPSLERESSSGLHKQLVPYHPPKDDTMIQSVLAQTKNLEEYQEALHYLFRQKLKDDTVIQSVLALTENPKEYQDALHYLFCRG